MHLCIINRIWINIPDKAKLFSNINYHSSSGHWEYTNFPLVLLLSMWCIKERRTYNKTTPNLLLCLSTNLITDLVYNLLFK